MSASDDVARGLFQAGAAAYDAGDYAEALSFFDQAYARSPRPQMLFNIGQAADRLRSDERALEAFRAYLEQLPDAENRDVVEARVTALERAVQERKAAADAAPVAAVTAPTPAEAAQVAPMSPSSDDAGHGDAARTGADADDGTPITARWWFWGGLGAVVVGGAAVALAVALGGDDAGRAAPYEGNGGSFPGP